MLGVSLFCSAGAEGVELEDPAALGFGRPGVLLDGTWSGEQEFSDGVGEVSLSEVRLLAPFYKFGSGDTVGGVSLRYAGTWLEESSLGRVFLQEVALQVSVFHDPKDSPWWALGLIRAGVSSDFEEISGDDGVATLLGLAGYEASPRLLWAVGGVVRADAESVTALPAVGVVWKPSERWTVQATPPFLVLGCKLGEGLSTSLSAYPGGGRWDLDGRGDGAESVRVTQWRVAWGLRYAATEHINLSLRAGVNVGSELEIQDERERVIRGSDLEVAPFVSLAAQWVF